MLIRENLRSLAVIARLSSMLMLVIFAMASGCDRKRPGKFVYVLVDYSGSTLPKPEKVDSYRQVLDVIAKDIGQGDCIFVAKITDRSMTNFELIYEQAFPTMNFMTDDQIGFDMKIRHTREALRDALDRAFKERLSQNASRTDIMGSLSVASQYLRNSKPETRKALFILSDMVEDSADYNFNRLDLTAARTSEIIANEKRLERMPDLKGIRVFVSGASANTAEQTLKIKKFWMAYFHEAGADLRETDYVPFLVSFSLE